MTVTTPSVIAPQAPPATTLAPTENQNQENSQVPDQTPAPFESDEQQPNNWQELDNVLEADRYDPQWTLLSLFIKLPLFEIDICHIANLSMCYIGD